MKDSERIAKAIQKKTKEAVKDAVRQARSTLDEDLEREGIVRIPPEFIEDSDNLLENGSFEDDKTFHYNPNDWGFYQCEAFVMDYRYQPSDPDAIYVPSAGAGSIPMPGVDVPDADIVAGNHLSIIEFPEG